MNNSGSDNCALIPMLAPSRERLMTLVTRGLLDVLAAERVAVEHPVTGDDFLFDQGTIGIAPRGKQILSGFATLIRAVMPAIDIAFDGLHAAAGSFLIRGSSHSKRVRPFLSFLRVQARL